MELESPPLPEEVVSSHDRDFAKIRQTALALADCATDLWGVHLPDDISKFMAEFALANNDWMWNDESNFVCNPNADNRYASSIYCIM